jgi:hypothetical protein
MTGNLEGSGRGQSCHYPEMGMELLKAKNIPFGISAALAEIRTYHDSYTIQEHLFYTPWYPSRNN